MECMEREVCLYYTFIFQKISHEGAHRIGKLCLKYVASLIDDKLPIVCLQGQIYASCMCWSPTVCYEIILLLCSAFLKTWCWDLELCILLCSTGDEFPWIFVCWNSSFSWAGWGVEREWPYLHDLIYMAKDTGIKKPTELSPSSYDNWTRHSRYKLDFGQEL